MEQGSSRVEVGQAVGGPVGRPGLSEGWGQILALRPDPDPTPVQLDTALGCSDVHHLFRWCRFKETHWGCYRVTEGKGNEFPLLLTEP